MALFGKSRLNGNYGKPAMGGVNAQMPMAGDIQAMQQMPMGQMQRGDEFFAPAQPEASSLGVNWGEVARNVLGNVGDAVSTYYGGPRVFAEQQALQQQAALIAEQQRQRSLLQAERLAAAESKPPKPGGFEWYQSATPEERALYDQYNPFTVPTGAGPIRVPRQNLNANQNRPPIGTVVSAEELGF